MKKISISFFIITFISFLFAKDLNSTQIIETGSWIYDAMNILCSENRTAFFTEDQPMSVGELKMYYSKIDEEKLTESGKYFYKKLHDELYTSKNLLKSDELRFFANCKLNPELYFRTNEDFDFTFNPYLSDYVFKLPIILGFSDFVTIQSDLFLGKSSVALNNKGNWNNIPFSGSEVEFLFPRFAYGSTGYTGNNWGVNLILGKEGVKIGNTTIGSILLNDTFETDFYTQLSLYSKYFKYKLNISQIDNTKYLYLHQINVKLFNNFKIGIVEGSLLNAPFELRYLNPLMIMHSFSSWSQYENSLSKKEYDLYTEGRFCAYLGFTMEWLPVSNMRVYGMYSQNEILDLGGSPNDYDLSVPDSLGGQLGIEYIFHLPNTSMIKTSLEGIYCSPYLYVKQAKDWSLYREREDKQSGKKVASWVGSPFGPDTFALQLQGQYDPCSNWSLTFGYQFKIHGENNKNIFTTENIVDENGNEITIYNYYPSVKYLLAQNDEDRKNAKDEGRNMWMTGINEYNHHIFISGNYKLNSNIVFNGKMSYTYSINNKNINNKTAQNFEMALGAEFKLLK